MRISLDEYIMNGLLDQRMDTSDNNKALGY